VDTAADQRNPQTTGAAPSDVPVERRVTAPLGPDNKPMRWWVAGVTGDTYLELTSDFRRPNAYPGDRATFPHGISLDFKHDLTDPHTLARAFVVAETIQALHEALEWVTVDGHRIADPHPVDEDHVWDWLVTEVGRLVDTYAQRWPADPTAGCTHPTLSHPTLPHPEQDTER
jgi:hypothetical protein